MTRYYFDLRESGRIIADESGQDLPDIEAARKKAVDAIGDAIRDHTIEGPEDLIVINVRDDQDSVLTVSAVLRVEYRK